MRGFEHRGIIEGYYGPPYSHRERLAWVERLGRWGMNRYVYAPKDDPLHRAQWRAPYPAETLAEFRELVERGAACGVQVGFALSPGLSIEYASREDVAALADKFAAFAGLGTRFFCLALDDVPTHLTHAGDQKQFDSLAGAHVALAHALAEALSGALADGGALCLVPTDYMGTDATAYLDEMGATLDTGIEVGWTGRTVVSPTVTIDEARARAATLGRRVLLWDNYPVTDGPMRPMLHLGPYAGREPGLDEFVCGALLNPMEHARASGVAVHTAAAYLRDPASYDADAAWETATAEIGEGAADAFRVFASAHRFSALDPSARDSSLETVWSRVRSEPGAAPDRTAMRDLLEERTTVAEALRRDLHDRDLAREIEPWIASHAAETERMRAAFDCLEALSSGASRLDKALAFMRMEGRLTRIPVPLTTSYGPRRVLYPQLVCLHDDAAAFGVDPFLYTDRCLADEMVAFAQRRASDLLSGSPGRGKD